MEIRTTFDFLLFTRRYYTRAIGMLVNPMVVFELSYQRDFLDRIDRLLSSESRILLHLPFSMHLCVCAGYIFMRESAS